MTKRWMLTQGARGWAGVALAAAMMASLAGPAGAAGGGGGGGMPSMPSESAPSYDPAEEYRQGLAALQAGKFADAKRNFDHVLAAAPRDANANYLAGAARAGLKDLKGALRFFEKAIKYDDSLILAHQSPAGRTVVNHPAAELTRPTSRAAPVPRRGMVWPGCDTPLM